MSEDPHCFTTTGQTCSDIRWLLSAPPLTSDLPLQMDHQWLSKFADKLAVEDIAAEAYSGSRRLGFYYQWLWLKLIQAHPDYELVAHEVQLNWNRQTVGAIDFLVRNKLTHSLEHWEVAVKFYLAYRQQWLGPNARDNLDKKIERMHTHQLELCNHPAYQLNGQKKWGMPQARRLIMQGRLFTNPYRVETGSALAINPEVVTGHWCFARELSQGPWRELDKSQWLSPPDYNALTKQFAPEKLYNPVQIVNPDNQIWFVVPDHWPKK